MAGGPILPGEDDTLFQEPIINGPDDVMDDGADGAVEMDPEEFQALIGYAVNAAESYVDTELSPVRELSQRYYNGEKFGNEVEGRSEIVATEVRDAILAMMPALLRIFAGTTDPVEFEANPGTPSEQADQQTRYVSHILMRDNPGFEIIHDAIKDALQKKTGIFTWWWEERTTVTADQFTDLPEKAFLMLQLDADDASDADLGLAYDIEITDERPDESQPGGDMVPDPLATATPQDDALMGQEAPMLRSGVLRRRMLRRRVRVAAVPPEEFIVTPFTSRDLDRFPFIGRRQVLTIGEIVALGHDEDEVRDAIGGSGDRAPALETNPEALARNNGAGVERLFDAGFEQQDPASEHIKYVVAYVLVDFDGDGIPERRKVVTVGAHNAVIYNEIFDDDMVPFGTICPDPEQHSPFGGSVFDWTADLQEVKSELMRGTLDSLSESITSSRAVNRRNVNLDDAMNPTRGALIRVDGAPSENIMDLSKPFVGANTLPVLAYVDEMKIRRTGTNPASPTGLDMDALQSTAKEGVAAAVEAAHDRVEMVARIFAETGFSRLFRGVRNLTVRHQDFRRSLRLMGTPVIVDPRTWVADLDCVVRAGIGRGMGQKRLQGLGVILTKQEQAIQTYGPDNPVVSMQEYAYTLGEFCRELGFSDPTRFVKPYTPEMQQKADALAQQAASQPTPQQLLYKAQSEKTQADLQARMAALAEKREAAIRKDATATAQANMTFALGAAKLLGEYGKASEEQALKLRQADDADMHRIADDLNASAPEPKPAPLPAPANPEGASNGDA